MVGEKLVDAMEELQRFGTRLAFQGLGHQRSRGGRDRA
jgi:hypothetical protein